MTTKSPDKLKDKVEADFNPAESAHERLERLKREAAAVEAEIRAEEQGTLNEVLRPAIDDLVKVLEQQTGKKCRSFTLRYQQPGDGDPGSVPVRLPDADGKVKLEQGKPGLVIAFRVVKPRQKDS